MFIRHAQQHHGRTFRNPPALLPIAQGTDADAQHGSELFLSQAITLADLYNIRTFQMNLMSRLLFSTQDGTPFFYAGY